MKLKVETDMNRIPILSFFSGGGFLDIGFEMSNFDIVWSNEVEERYAEIHQHGLQTWRTSIDSNQSRSSYVNLDSIDKLKKSTIIKEAFGSLLPDFFGLIGGPPCQDFSHSGHNKGVIGERGTFHTNIY